MLKLRECQRCHGRYEGHGNSRYCASCRYEAHLEASREVYQRNRKKKIETMEPRKCWDCGKELKTTDGRTIRCDRCQYKHELKAYDKRVAKLRINTSLIRALDINVDTLIAKANELHASLEPLEFDSVMASFKNSRMVKIMVNNLTPGDRDKLANMYKELGINE